MRVVPPSRAYRHWVSRHLPKEANMMYSSQHRDGLAERTVRVLPHVTPSPRVPAAREQRRSVSTSFSLVVPALVMRNGLAERTLGVLPHVTPSPRVPAASRQRRSVPALTAFIRVGFAHRPHTQATGDGSAVTKATTLPHVTPSPRVPAAGRCCRPVSTRPHTQATGDGSAVTKATTLPHVTPSPRVLAAGRCCRPVSNWPHTQATGEAPPKRGSRACLSHNITAPLYLPATHIPRGVSPRNLSE
jgi:hypothetical protein